MVKLVSGRIVNGREPLKRVHEFRGRQPRKRFELPAQMRLVCKTGFQTETAQVELRTGEQVTVDGVQTCYPHVLLGRKADLLFQFPFELTPADVNHPGQFIHFRGCAGMAYQVGGTIQIRFFGIMLLELMQQVLMGKLQLLPDIPSLRNA